MTTKSTAGHTPGEYRLAVRWAEKSAILESSHGERLAETRDSSVGKALERIATAYNFALQYKSERDRLRAENATLLGALKRIADGQVVTGEFSHAEVIVAYQEIARAALAKAEGRS